MILAPNGRPARRELAFNSPLQPKATGSGLFATPSSTGTADYYRPRNYSFGGNLESHLNGRQLYELRSSSRQLFSQVAILYAAIQQKATYAVGDSWQPQYYGTNKAWGEQAEEWLAEAFYPVADLRGSGFDVATNLLLYSLALDVDGDEAMLLTSSESGFPQVMFLPSDRIAGEAQEIKDAGSSFKGARLVNGCILNRDGRVIGYRVTEGNAPSEFKDYSTANCHLGFEPLFTGQRRGIPKIAPALLTWMDLQDIDVFIKRIVKIHSSQGIAHYTETGTADTAETAISDNEDAGATDTDLKIQRVEGGEFTYMKAGSGEKLEPFNSTTPHQNTEEFVRRLQREGTRAVDWYYELTDPSGIGGAPVRLIQDGARASVRHRQKTIKRRFRRIIGYAVAKAMKEKLLPRNDVDWWKFEPQLPGQITVDEGYTRAADIEDLKLGLTSKSKICSKNGGWYEDTDLQRDKEFDAYVTRCKAHAQKHGLPLAWVLDHLEQSNPNPVGIQQETAQPQPAGKPATKT